MTAEHPDSEREAPALPPPRFAGPLAFSVVLHAVVLLLFARTVFAPAKVAAPDAAADGIRVSLVVRPPPLVPAPDEAQAPPPQLMEPDASADAALVEPEAVASLAEAAPVQPGAVAETGPPQPSTLPAEPSSDDEPGTASGAWTPARIRAAVQASSGELRGRATTAWMETCILERKQRGTLDCERALQQQDSLSPDAAAGHAAGIGAFANVTRPDQQWLRAEQFKKDNATLRELVDAGGVVGELATARYYLNRDYIIYLSGNRVNGNHNDMVFHAMQNFAADELGGSRLTLNGDTPFQCGSGKIQVERAHVGNIVPCIYEFTGFNIDRPERDPDAFRVVPIVFGKQR